MSKVDLCQFLLSSGQLKAGNKQQTNNETNTSAFRDDQDGEGGGSLAQVSL